MSAIGTPVILVARTFKKIASCGRGSESAISKINCLPNREHVFPTGHRLKPMLQAKARATSWASCSMLF